MDNATKALAADEHDPPRTARPAEKSGRTTRSPRHISRGRRTPSRPSIFVVANPPSPPRHGEQPASIRQTDLYGRFAFGIPAAKNGDLRLPPAYPTCSQKHRQGRGNSSRTASCSGAAPNPPSGREIVRRGYIQGNHRPAGESLLRYGHPGVYRCPRQGECPRPPRASS